MSKYIATIPLEKIERISILPGNGRSLAQVKQGADYIINGGFYDMSSGKAVGHLKVDGKLWAEEPWNTWGFSWDLPSDLSMRAVPDAGRSNYISGVELLSPSKDAQAKLSYNADVGGRRGRTAMALSEDGLILYCSGDGTKDAGTPESLRDELARLGARRAIMLDGGGSSQCSFPEGEIVSARKVHNHIAVWLKRAGEQVEKEEGKEVGEKVKKVVLDPGHGVETAGKCAPDKTYYEHEFALDLAGRLKAQLERHGVTVVMTRSGQNDVSLQTRVKIANSASPDLFVSLHSNASGDGTGWTFPCGYGIYTSAAGESAERNKAAKAILRRVKSAGVELWGNGLQHDIDLYVLRDTTAPAVLIEHGFHTNKEEVQLLKDPDYRRLLAETDAQGILDHLGIPWVEERQESDGDEEDRYEPQPWCVCPHCGEKLKIGKG